MSGEEDSDAVRNGEGLRRSRDPHVPIRRVQCRQHSVRHSHMQRYSLVTSFH